MQKYSKTEAKDKLAVVGLTRCCIMACLCALSFLTAVKTSQRRSLLICWTRMERPTYTLLRSDPYLHTCHVALDRANKCRSLNIDDRVG